MEAARHGEGASCAPLQHDLGTGLCLCSYLACHGQAVQGEAGAISPRHRVHRGPRPEAEVGGVGDGGCQPGRDQARLGVGVDCPEPTGGVDGAELERRGQASLGLFQEGQNSQKDLAVEVEGLAGRPLTRHDGHSLRCSPRVCRSPPPSLVGCREEGAKRQAEGLVMKGRWSCEKDLRDAGAQFTGRRARRTEERPCRFVPLETESNTGRLGKLTGEG